MTDILSDAEIQAVNNKLEDRNNPLTQAQVDVITPRLELGEKLGADYMNRAMSMRVTPALNIDTNKVNLFADADLAIPAQSDNETEEQRKEREDLEQRKTNANRVLDAIVALSYNGDKSKFEDWRVQGEKKYQAQFKGIKPEQAQIVQSQLLLDQYKSYTDSYGVLPYNILTNDNFMKYVDPNNYRYFASSYNMAHADGIIDHIGRSLSQGRAERASLFEFLEGKISNDELNRRLEGISSFYSSPSDWGWVSETYKMLSNLYSPIIDNGKTSLLGAIAGLTMPGGWALFTGLTIGRDSAALAQASMANQILYENPELDTRQLLGRLAPFAYMIGALDIGGVEILAKFAGKDLIKQQAIKLFEKTGLKKLVAETGKIELGDRAVKTFENVVKDVAVGIGKGAVKTGTATASEVGIEVGQDVIGQVAVNKELGKTGKEALQEIVNTAKQTATETPAPILAMMVLFGFPKGTAFALRSMNDLSHAYNSAKNRAADEVTAEAPMNEQNQTAADEVIDEVLTSKMYGNASEIAQRLKNANISEEKAGLNLTNKLKKAQNGDPIVVSRSEYKNYSPEIRDLINDCFTDKEGNSIAADMKEFYSEEELAEKRKELNNQIPVVEQIRKEQIDVEKKVYKDLIGKVKGVSPEQASELSHLTSLFVTALSRAVDMPINDIFNKYKPTYELYDVDNFTQKKGVLDNPDVLAVYDAKANKIIYKQNVDFSSVFHETAHWYLQTLRLMAKENTQVAEQLEQLGRWAGVKDVTNLSDEDFNNLSEKFVAGFISALITGKGYSAELKPFKKFLNSIRNISLFKHFDRLAGITKEEHLKQGFESTYGTELPNVNQDFMQFINSMFASEVYSELQEMSYSSSSNILDQIDSWSINEADKVAIKEELNKSLQETNGVIDNQIQMFTTKQALSELTKGGRKFAEFLRGVLRNAPEKVKNQKAYISYLNKLIKAAEDFEAIANAEEEALNATPLYQYLNGKLKAVKINTNGLTERQIKVLAQKGYIGSDTTGVGIEDLVNDPALPQEIKDVLDNAETSKSSALYKFLAVTPTAKEQAQQLAMEQIKPYFEKDIVEDYAKLQIDIAKVHKSLTKSTLFGIAKALGTDRETVKANTAMIEYIAEQDVDAQTFSKAKATIYTSNAARENRNAMKSFAKHEPEGIDNGIKHLRNEYYQNHKAQYVTELKNNIVKRLDNCKKVARWSDKKVKTNGYDTDYIDFLRHVLYRIGYSTREPVQTLEEIQNSIIERFPSEKDKINDMMNTLKEDKTLETYWQNQTFSQLQDTLDMLETIITSGKNATSTLIDGKRMEYETVVDALISAKGFKEEKSKLRDMKSGKGKSSVTRKKTLLDKIKAAVRVYSSSIMLMEHFCQIMDAAQLGKWHEYIFQPIKDAETAFKLAYEKAYIRLQNTLNKVNRIETQPIEATELILKDGSKWEIGAKNGKFAGKSTLELLGMMLHMGANFDKFLDGYLADAKHIDENDRTAQLKYKRDCFEAFFQRMVREKHITKEMMDFCQTAWNVNEDLYPDVQKANKEINGYAFKKLQTRTIKVNFGGKDYIYKAGYIPAMLSDDAMPSVSKEASLTDNASHLKDNVPYKEPSFVKSRTNEAYRLELDPIRLVGQVKETARFAYLMPTVVRTEKIFKNQQFREQLQEKFPDLYENFISKWLTDVATLSSTKIGNALERLTNAYVRGAAMQLMCLNAVNILQQTAQFATLLTKCNMIDIMGAFYDTMMHPIKVSEEMFAESEFMRMRIQEKSNGINELFNEITVKASSYESAFDKGVAGAKQVNDFITKNTYIGQKICQNLIDRVGYRAAKRAAARLGYTGKDAVRYAEMTVREVFTSFDISDVAGVQRSNPVVKAFTMFTGYFISMYQLNKVEYKIACSKYGILNPMRYLSLAYATSCCYVFNTWIAEGISMAMRGDWGDDDDDTLDSFMIHMAIAPVRTRNNALPVFNKVSDSYLDKVEGKSFYSSAMLSTPVLTETTAGGKAIYKMLFTDEEIKGRDIKAAMQLSGIILNSPAPGFLARPVSHIYDVAEGNVADETPIEFVMASMTATAPKNRLN